MLSQSGVAWSCAVAAWQSVTCVVLLRAWTAAEPLLGRLDPVSTVPTGRLLEGEIAGEMDLTTVLPLVVLPT